MIKFDQKKLARHTNIHFTAQVKQYLRDAKATMSREFESETDPKRKKELEEGSYYIELLSDSLIEKIGKPEFHFQTKDLGL